MSNTDFDDLEDDAFTAPRNAGERTEAVAKAVEAAATLANWEPCAKCRGTGVWRGNYKSANCFACKGAGKVSRGFNARSAGAAKAKVTREHNEKVRVQEFGVEYPAEWRWLCEAMGNGNEFAASLCEAVRSRGGLTEGQMAAVRSNIAKQAARAEERKLGVAIDVTGLQAAFDVARSKGAKRASIRTAEITFSLAKAEGQNPGAIYAKSRVGSEYLGKIVNGKLHKAFACTPGHVDQIVEAARDPKGAALRYAQVTGECSICGAELTDKDSIAAGIGPVCATKFGW